MSYTMLSRVFGKMMLRLLPPWISTLERRTMLTTGLTMSGYDSGLGRWIQ
jgi:hypothetical protein